MPGHIVDADPFADDFIADPWADLARIREASPAAFLPEYGVWAVARHDEVQAVLRDMRTYSSEAGIGYVDVRHGEPWRSPSLILEADRPMHTRTRRVLGGILSEHALRKWKPQLCGDAERMVDSLVRREKFDAVRDLAEAYTLRVFGDAVGLPADDRERLLEYGAMAFDANGPRNDRFTAAMEDRSGTVEWTMRHCCRGALSPYGFGAAVYRWADSGTITNDEARLLVRSLLSAGVDTTVSALGFAVLAFTQHPEQWAALRANKALLHSAIDEILRFQPPFMGVFRTTSRPARLGGAVLGPDTKVLVLLAGACRDPRRWESPDRFDITRDATGHTAFGYGIHRCVGHAVARLELGAMLTALLERVKSWAALGPPAPKLNNTLRGLASLPVHVMAE